MIHLAAQSQSLLDLGVHIILGGFGLFMIGINLLGDGFKKVAGSRMRDYIDKYTSNLFSAILVGALITGIMQSSSAATVISISLVRAGLMTLNQAIGISLGANIGTTMTAIIVGLNIDEMGYFFLFLGAMMVLFSSRSKVKNYGQVILAFGLTFVGLQIMSEKLLLIQKMPFFEELMLQLSDHPWMAMMGGTVLTAIINSSSATIAVVQKIYGNGGIGIVAATAFVFGANIGTTVTALFASMGGSISTRRAGLFHTMFNIIGATLIMFIIQPYSAFILVLNQWIGGSDAMAIGLAHFVFNLTFAILVIPFVPMFIRLLEILIPGEEKVRSREKLKPLDQDLIRTYPEGALQLAKKRTVKMGELVIESIEETHRFLQSGDQEDYDVVMQLEEIINQIDIEVTSYLLEIMQNSPADTHIANTFTKNLEIVKNYERMSDLSTNLVEFYALTFDNREKFSEEALADLDTMYQLLLDMLRRSHKILRTEDLKRYDDLIRDEEYLDLIETKYREKHFQRMAEGICDEKVTSSIYVDILGILERIGDHGVNVARYVNSAIKLHND